MRGPPFRRKRLQRRLFVWFGVSILCTLISVALVLHVLPGGERGWGDVGDRFRQFTSNQLAEVWDDPARRAALVGAMARDLRVEVELRDAHGARLERVGACEDVDFTAPIRTQDGRALGELRVCRVWHLRGHGSGLHAQPLIVMFVAGLTLWLASGAISRRLTRPLRQLAHVTEELGAGNLGSRVRLNPHWPGEIGALAESVNRMGARIERQIKDQRELLAAVSHEIRSPLARVRVALELLRETDPGADDGARQRAISRIEREVSEMDSLVGELLASSRIQFSALEPRLLDARDLALSALERAGVGARILVAPDGDLACEGDPTLLTRALVNVLENALRHAGSVTSLRIEATPETMTWIVEDAGPGFAPDEIANVFQPFVRGRDAGGQSLGLGLSLVERIAAGHRGRAWAENLPGGGGRVGLGIPRRQSEGAGAAGGRSRL